MALPRTEKLPMALRKNVRDEFTNNIEDFESQLTEILGQEWKVNIDPNSMHPYAKSGSYADANLGGCLASYVKGAIDSLKEFKEKFGDDGITEMNDTCTAHELTMDFDPAKKFYYCGCDINDGALRMLFTEGNLGTNIGNVCQLDNLSKALNEAPAPAGALSFKAKAGIREEYDAEIEKTREEIATMLECPDIELDPNFAEVFGKLKNGEGVMSSWEDNLGRFHRMYFEGLVYQLKSQGFDSDEDYKEGFKEGISENKIVIRVLDELKEGHYNECEIADGILYLQTTARNWGCNIGDCARELQNKL